MRTHPWPLLPDVATTVNKVGTAEALFRVRRPEFLLQPDAHVYVRPGRALVQLIASSAVYDAQDARHLAKLLLRAADQSEGIVRRR